jgi:hypothetical protein
VAFLQCTSLRSVLIFCLSHPSYIFNPCSHLHFTTITVLGDLHMSGSFFLYNIPNYSHTSFILGPDIFLGTLISGIWNLCSSLRIRDHISQQLKITGYIKNFNLFHRIVMMMVMMKMKTMMDMKILHYSIRAQHSSNQQCTWWQIWNVSNPGGKDPNCAIEPTGCWVWKAQLLKSCMLER